MRDAIDPVNTVHKRVNQKFVLSEQDHRIELRRVQVRRSPKAALLA